MKILLENHPNDSRVKYASGEICQTLSSRMGTGGGNVPMLLEIDDEASIHSQLGGKTTHTPVGEVTETVQAAYGMGGGNTPLVVEYESESGPRESAGRDLADGDSW